MKILYLMPYNPVKPTFGGALRIYHILVHLLKHHDVTVAGFSSKKDENLLVERFPLLKGRTHFVDHPYPEKLKRWSLLASLFSSHSHWYKLSQSKPLQKELDILLSREQFDIIQSEFPVLAMNRLNSNALKIIDCHNVEYDNFRRMAIVKNSFRKLFYYYESYKFSREEIGICRKQDALFVTSDRDIALLNTSVLNTPKYLVPNGVDANYFHPLKLKPNPHSLVFVGMMKYLPNSDGMLYFLDEVFPKILNQYPDTTITIIGKDPSDALLRRANKHIIVTGFVEDTRPYIQKAAVYVVPLRMGGGTRLKIVEALALKKPIVTTSIGCEGIDVENRKSVLIGDTSQEFAEAVMELFSNNELSKSLVDNGYDLVINKYRWPNIGKLIDKAYEELLGLKSPLKIHEEAVERMDNESNSFQPEHEAGTHL